MEAGEKEDIINSVIIRLKAAETFEQGSNQPKKDDELKKIAKLAIEEMMTLWGIDVNNPLEMQEDFAWARKNRKLAEKIGSAIFVFIAIAVVGGIIGLVVKSLWPENGGK